MHKLNLPSKAEGMWIWSSEPAVSGAYLLMRKTFQVDAPGMDNVLWVAARGRYQLYINERFIGFGPGQPGDFCADEYDVSGEIQSGLNAVSLIVYDDVVREGGKPGFPKGIWCQLMCDGCLKLKSDSSWDVRSGSFQTAPRSRFGERLRMNESIDMRHYPSGWMRVRYTPGMSWHKPDCCIPVRDLKTDLAVSPVAPATVDVPVAVRAAERGTVRMPQAWSLVTFGNRHRNSAAVCAAESFLYSGKEMTVPVRVSSDDPFRFFCGMEEIVSGENAFGETEYRLRLHPGWTRLLLTQTPGLDSMGFLLLFPSWKKEELHLYSAPAESAEPGWKIAGPLKLPIENAAHSLFFKRLETEVVNFTEKDVTDQATRLRFAEFCPSGEHEDPMLLRTGEYLKMNLDSLRYGFAVLSVSADEGDILDLTLGRRTAENGLPVYGDRNRCTHRLICRDGINFFRLFNPCEVLSVTLSVRKARGAVRVHDCSFEELVREESHGTEFRCSSETLNAVWNTGLRTLRRTGAFIGHPGSESKRYICCLADAYMDAVNMIAAFGDLDYSAARLRQFADAQFETGDIPAFSPSGKGRSQLFQLFVFPVWMAYNFWESGNRDELLALEPHLDALLDYLCSMADAGNGLMGDPGERAREENRLSESVFAEEEHPVMLNALFCLALISAADVYCSLGREGDSDKVLERAAETAAKVRERYFDARTGLFGRGVPKSRQKSLLTEQDLFGNFAALLGGLMPAEKMDVFWETYFQQEEPFDRIAEAGNPYFHYFFIETMFALKHRDWTFRYFLNYWQKRMDAEKGVWKNWRDGESVPDLRFSRGSLVCPNVFLVREVAGIRAAGPAYSVIYVNPLFSAADWADVTLPTVSGTIHVRWEKLPDGMLRILIESSYPLRVLPQLKPEEMNRTEFVLRGNVALLQGDSSPELERV